jgi:hypothetical protein
VCRQGWMSQQSPGSMAMVLPPSLILPILKSVCTMTMQTAGQEKWWWGERELKASKWRSNSCVKIFKNNVIVISFYNQQWCWWTYSCLRYHSSNLDILKVQLVQTQKELITTITKNMRTRYLQCIISKCDVICILWDSIMNTIFILSKETNAISTPRKIQNSVFISSLLYKSNLG